MCCPVSRHLIDWGHGLFALVDDPNEIVPYDLNELLDLH